MNPIPQIPIRLPPGEARSIASIVLGSGVAVGLFLAPYLGTQRIAGFESLIAIFPESQRNLLIPISSFLVGVLTLVVQFYAREIITRRSISRSFPVLALIVVASLIALLMLYSRCVYVWENPEQVVIVGWSRLPGCACPPENTRLCIQGLAFIDLGSCWSDEAIWRVKVSLFLFYLLSIEGFVGLAGLMVLQRKLAREQKKKEEEKEKEEAEEKAAEEETRRQMEAEAKKAQRQARKSKQADPTVSEKVPATKAAPEDPEPSGGAEPPKAVPSRRRKKT